ncbi:MAG: spore germination protein GerW family protein [Chitinispirillaceae bacterium]|nr:spore germination protein GerW family protein [Chitinispirillaceae bacterium]
MASLTDIIKAALEKIQYIAKTETVIGEPIKVGETTLIPVSRISIGFAAGGAGKEEKAENGAGTGGGISIVPVAFITISGERVQVHPLTPTDPLVSKIMSIAPDIINNVSKYFKSKDKKDKAKEKESSGGEKRE